MDIEEHLALHDSAIRAWVGTTVMGNPDLADDAYQNIVLFMIELHESGTYDHDKSQLYTYVFPYLRAIAFKGLSPERLYGIKDELDTLQEIAEEQGRDRLHLDRLYDEPLEGLRTPLESTLSPEEQEQAEKVMSNLSDQDREILEASYGRSGRQAAELLGIPESTYRYRLMKARERAEKITRQT